MRQLDEGVAVGNEFSGRDATLDGVPQAAVLRKLGHDVAVFPPVSSLARQSCQLADPAAGAA